LPRYTGPVPETESFQSGWDCGASPGYRHAANRAENSGSTADGRRSDGRGAQGAEQAAFDIRKIHGDGDPTDRNLI